MSSPEPFAKRDDAVLPDYVFLSRESAPEQWRHAEQWKEAGRNARDFNPPRLAFAGQVQIDESVAGHLGEGFIAGDVIEHFRGRDAAKVQTQLRKMLLDERDSLRLLVWQRPQQHGVNDAEDRRDGPDAQTERNHHNQNTSTFLNYN